MKNLFQSCKKAHSKYVTILTELEIEDEMEWLSNLQKLMADINLQLLKMEQYKHESRSKVWRLERMIISQFNGDIRFIQGLIQIFKNKYNQRWEVSRK